MIAIYWLKVGLLLPYFPESLLSSLEHQQATISLPPGSLWLSSGSCFPGQQWFSNGKQGGYHFGLGEWNSAFPFLPCNPRTCFYIFPNFLQHTRDQVINFTEDYQTMWGTCNTKNTTNNCTGQIFSRFHCQTSFLTQADFPVKHHLIGDNYVYIHMCIHAYMCTSI